MKTQKKSSLFSILITYFFLFGCTPENKTVIESNTDKSDLSNSNTTNSINEDSSENKICQKPNDKKFVSEGSVFFSYKKSNGVSQNECETLKIKSICNKNKKFEPKPGEFYSCSLSNSNSTTTVTTNSPVSKSCLNPKTMTSTKNDVITYKISTGTQAECDNSKVTSVCQQTTGLFLPEITLNSFTSCMVKIQVSNNIKSIDELESGTWYEVPNSKLSALAPAKLQGGYFSAIVDAWNGGAFDTKRDRLIIWGGGHGDYAGNEIYTFDLNSLSWSRVIEPSTVKAGVIQFPNGRYEDGLPVSRHTYNYIQYLPEPIDRFCTFGGAALWQTGQYGTSDVDCFDFEKNQWEVKKFPSTTSSTIGAVTAYDPINQILYQHGGSGNIGLSKLNLKTSTWDQLWATFSSAGETLGYYRTADIDYKRQTMIAVGGGKVLSWNLSKAGLNYAIPLVTTGPKIVETIGNPGFVYVPTQNAFIGWAGGNSLYKLDLSNNTWSEIIPSPANVHNAPLTQNQQGTFGRFRYSPNKKAFVLVNNVNQNVYIYKL